MAIGAPAGTRDVKLRRDLQYGKRLSGRFIDDDVGWSRDIAAASDHQRQRTDRAPRSRLSWKIGLKVGPTLKYQSLKWKIRGEGELYTGSPPPRVNDREPLLAL